MTGSGLSKISPLGVLLAVLALLVAACGGSSEQRATTGPWPEANALFRQDVRWLGADDAYSVALGDDRVAWLFADSLVGTGSPPERPPFPTARNSIGLQIGSNPARTRMTFYWRTTRKGNPASFFPDERDVWFWPGDGERLGSDGPLLIFLMRIRQDPTGQPGWDFKADGWEAVRIANADEEPDAWRVEHIPSPPNPWGIVVGSASVLAHEGWLYAFSTREPPPHDVHLVRWPLAAAIAGDLSAPEWWAGRSRGFVVQTELAGPPAPLFEDGQTEFTVHEAAGEFAPCRRSASARPRSVCAPRRHSAGLGPMSERPGARPRPTGRERLSTLRNPTPSWTPAMRSRSPTSRATSTSLRSSQTNRSTTPGSSVSASNELSPITHGSCSSGSFVATTRRPPRS